MFRIALRQQRTGLLGVSLFGMVTGTIQAAAFNSAAGTTPADRVAFAQQMDLIGRQVSYILPIPLRVDTMAGYLQWRVYGALPALCFIWAFMSATGATRGDEERGLVEEWLGAGVSRWRYVVTRFLAFTVAAAAVTALTSAAISGATAVAGSPLDLGQVAEVSFALLALTLACYAIPLVLSQLVTTRNAAAGLAGGVMTILFFINGFSRTVDSLVPVARVVSPFYYYDRSNALAPGGSFDLGGTLGLLVVALALTAAAAGLMELRDLGAPLLRRRARPRRTTHEPDRNPLIRIPVLSRLYEHRGALLAWTVGSAFGAAYYASLSRQIVDLVSSGGSAFRAYLTLAGHGNPYVTLTGAFWFGTFELLLSIFAITQVSQWAAEDREGRLEMELSAPVHRWWVVAERGIALLISTAVIIGVSSVALYLSAKATNIDIPPWDLTVASLVMVPFGVSFAAVGAVLATRAPRATVGLLAALAAVSFFMLQVGPLFKLPDWVLRLSVFTLIGTPLSEGVYWPGLWQLLAIVVVGFGLAMLLMQRREVGR